MMNKNERAGAVDQAKGKAKQVVATLTGNNDLKAEGQVDETVGKVESALGRNSQKIGDAITRIGAAVKKG
jgi:uncharacterized protein YjbJ (UPF0337 family)